MIEVLRIADLHERGFLCFDLRDLLRLVSDIGPRLTWAGVSMGEGTFITGSDGPRGGEACSLGERIDSEDEPVPFAWETFSTSLSL